jgi:hypothetical protein
LCLLTVLTGIPHAEAIVFMEYLFILNILPPHSNCATIMLYFDHFSVYLIPILYHICPPEPQPQSRPPQNPNESAIPVSPASSSYNTPYIKIRPSQVSPWHLTKSPYRAPKKFTRYGFSTIKPQKSLRGHIPLRAPRVAGGKGGTP